MLASSPAGTRSYFKPAWLITALGLVALMVWSATRHRPELSVDGLPVSGWAMRLLGPETQFHGREARAVIGSFTPDAAGDLAAMLRERDNLFKRPILAVARALPQRLSARWHGFWQPHHPGRRRAAAAQALQLMGTNALPARAALRGQAVHSCP